MFDTLETLILVSHTVTFNLDTPTPLDNSNLYALTFDTTRTLDAILIHDDPPALDTRTPIPAVNS